MQIKPVTQLDCMPTRAGQNKCRSRAASGRSAAGLPCSARRAGRPGRCGSHCAARALSCCGFPRARQGPPTTIADCVAYKHYDDKQSRKEYKQRRINEIISHPTDLCTHADYTSPCAMAQEWCKRSHPGVADEAFAHFATPRGWNAERRARRVDSESRRSYS